MFNYLSVKFNGLSLEDLINVTADFNPLNGSDWQNTTKDRESSDGSIFLYSKRGLKSIVMPFQMTGNITEKYDKLQSRIAVSKPSELIFGNLSDRFFMAVPNSTIDLIKSTNGYSATGTITWIVPSGVAESIEPVTVPAKIVNGVLTAEVENDSSAEVFPIYRIKNRAENGYIGIVHADGAFEMGNKEEADGYDYQDSETLLDTIDFSEFTAYTGVNPENAAKLNNGTLGVETQDGKQILKLTDAGTGDAWHGGSVVWTVPADHNGEIGADKFNAQIKSFFASNAYGQTGQQQLIYTTDTGQFIMSLSISKDDIIGNDARVVFHYVEELGGQIKELSRQSFGAGLITGTDNPFSLNKGSIGIRKEGQLLRFWTFKGQSEVNVPALASAKVGKVFINIYEYGTRSNAQNIKWNGVSSMNFFKNFVDFWRNVPNRYKDTQEIVVDCESANIYINQLYENEEMIDGSSFPPLPIGKTTIEFYLSSWADINDFDIVVEYRKRWG
ncbi:MULTISPECIES: distal tail protein Dit [unclassified Enterococcus]|uniref:distal tail protein Dit n=1 Tax=unclassified Enterococcus TaxID=2608891 RepID=UPI001557A062|nr:MULTISPECIES: distal tail protein Dit [unclassified Enterococcus]MBS7578461.1 phage tail family protein [Enterococcus sp. MMGLQ5-2]MBS7585674.1 phage tail family protein [Enterococcus sp. MMGLQ5-1]NPD13533.1 hypothetical protein [Enterococcus sp. MMGLQ5-1]NPD38293.1 hypothetical protein [Enterococcus sp. MMGLQ5-2]